MIDEFLAGTDLWVDPLDSKSGQIYSGGHREYPGQGYDGFFPPSVGVTGRICLRISDGIRPR